MLLKRYPDSLRSAINAELIPCFYKHHIFINITLLHPLFFVFFKKNSRQTCALHLMNSLLNIFCYIISNVSNRNNLHRVQLMTKSYPDRQNHFRTMSLIVYPVDLGQSSQDSKNLSKIPNNQRHALKWS